MQRQTQFLAFASLAALLLGSGGCSSNQGYPNDQVRLTGSIDRGLQADDVEPARPVPPDPYKGVRYKGGRDPVTGAAPALDGSMPQPQPSPAARKAAAIMSPTKVTMAPAAKDGSISVQPGDTLFGLARKHGVTVSALKKANALQSDTLVTGQTLVVLYPSPGSPAVDQLELVRVIGLQDLRAGTAPGRS